MISLGHFTKHLNRKLIATIQKLFEKKKTEEGEISNLFYEASITQTQ